MSFSIRPMEPGHVPAVAAIDQVSFPTPWPAAAFRRELGREGATYLVLVTKNNSQLALGSRRDSGWLGRLFRGEQRDRVIGYVGFRLEDETGHITTIAVHPDWRGRSFGKLLLLVALKRITESCRQVVTLELRPSNHVAYRLYRKYGFRIVGRRQSYYRDGEDAWVMEACTGEKAYGERLTALQEEVGPEFVALDQ